MTVVREICVQFSTQSYQRVGSQTKRLYLCAILWLVEGRHKLARTICHGKRGEIRKAYREGQEDQLNALGLVTNAVVLWNTLYMQAALEHLQSEGVASQPEDRARLSPLQHRHLNVLGRYSFALADPVTSGKLRPLNIEEWDEVA